MPVGSIEDALRTAIQIAKQRESKTVDRDDLLLGCLNAVSRFGIALIGTWPIDLEPLGIRWRRPHGDSGPRPAYSTEVVALLDEAAAIAARDGGSVEVTHALACFSEEEDGLMGMLRGQYGITSAGWRAALASLRALNQGAPNSTPPGPVARPYLTPEEGAAYLGLHIQTIRGYIRNGKLSALRIAGERAIRLRREDLDALLEPLQAQDSD